MTAKELVSRVQAIPGVDSPEVAEQVITAVFHTLRNRITPEEGQDLASQLPEAWKSWWESGGWWGRIAQGLRGVERLDRAAFIGRVQEEIPAGVEAEHAVRVIFHALKEQVSPGEVADVSAQLPEDLRTLWKAA